jgi:hypothetical protein
MKKLARPIALALVTAAVFAGGAAATYPYGTQHQYFGTATAYYGVANKSGFNYPQWNRVYRPLYHYFSLWYTDDSTAWGFKRNYTENPLVWPDPGGYAKSVCSHSDSEIQTPQYPVTCQYATNP